MIRTEWQKLTKHSRISDSNLDDSRFKNLIYKKPQMLKSICGFFVAKFRKLVAHFKSMSQTLTIIIAFQKDDLNGFLALFQLLAHQVVFLIR